MCKWCLCIWGDDWFHWHEYDMKVTHCSQGSQFLCIYIYICVCVCVGDEVTLFISHKYNKDGITLCVFFCLIWLTFPKQHCQKSGRCVCLYHWFIYWYLFKVDLTVTHTERNPTIKLPPLSKHWRQWERKTPLPIGWEVIQCVTLRHWVTTSFIKLSSFDHFGENVCSWKSALFVFLDLSIMILGDPID